MRAILWEDDKDVKWRILTVIVLVPLFLLVVIVGAVCYFHSMINKRDIRNKREVEDAHARYNDTPTNTGSLRCGGLTYVREETAAEVPK